MQTGRLKAEQQVWDLTNANNSKAQRIQELIADNEKLKRESQESITVKNQEISNLNVLKEEASMLKKMISEKDAEILKVNNDINLLKSKIAHKK